MSSTLSPLAQANLASLENFINTVRAGCDALEKDLSKEDAKVEENLTGDVFLDAAGMLMYACMMWRKLGQLMIEAQPEFKAWAAEQQVAEKPDLNG